MLEKRHREDMNRAQSEINNKISRTFKSKEALNLEYQIQKLARKQRYKEAALLKKKLSRLVDQEEEEFQRQALLQYNLLIENYKKKLEVDRFVLEQKLNRQKEELLAKRDNDFNTIHYKFNVFREKQEQIHKQQLLQKNKDLKNFNPCSNFVAK